MAVLSDLDLQEVLKNDEGIVISNLRGDSITALGYDLTIGLICDADDGSIPAKDPDINRYCLLPRHRYLIVSREYVSFPAQYMATIHARISYVLKGILFTSTTIDPNFEGFLYMSLINCSRNRVYIKENNQFATMVIHQILTPTDTNVQVNEDGTPRDGQETLNSPFSNVCEEAVKRTKIYVTDEFQKIKAGHREAQSRAAKKHQEKLDFEAHAQMLSEKAALDQQHLLNLQAQMDSLQAELDESRKTIEAEKKKRHWITVILRLIIAIVLFGFLLYYWGITILTVIVPIIVPVFFEIPGFLLDSEELLKKIKKK